MLIRATVALLTSVALLAVAGGLAVGLAVFLTELAPYVGAGLVLLAGGAVAGGLLLARNEHDHRRWLAEDRAYQLANERLALLLAHARTRPPALPEQIVDSTAQVWRID